MSLLLRLLLVATLLAAPPGSAWTATGMAVASARAAGPVDTDAGPHAMPGCHQDAAPAAVHTMPCGNDSQHCDCLQPCPALPCSVPAVAALAGPPRPAASNDPAGTPPRLADPVRPPIAHR